LLQTRRGLNWLDRAVDQGCGSLLCTSKAFAEGVDRTKWSPVGLFGPRQPTPDWTRDFCPIPLLDYHDFVLDDVAWHLIERQHQAVADIWLGLREGYLLAARRPRVLDELVSSGVELHVTSDGACVSHELWPHLPDDLAGALARRVRFLCRLRHSPPVGNQTLRVVDLGWGTRR
jgi:hypothetical protein